MFTTITATTSTAMILLFSLLLCFTPISSSSGHHRHILHQPFFPVEKTIPPSLPPSVPPKSFEPKYPFSSSTPTTSTTKSFFPSSLPSPPPSPSPPRPSLATFPANISSVLFPNSSHKPISKKLIALTISVSLLAFILLVSAFLYLFLHHKHHQHSPSIPSPNHKINVRAVSATESLRLFPQNTVASDGSFSKSPPALSKSIPSSSSTEFLYLGTLNSSENFKPSISGIKIGLQSSSPAYKKLGSPELYPLPPLPRTNLYASGEVGSSKNGNEVTDYEDEDDEEFFSPGGSSGERDGLARNGSSSRRVFMPVPIVNNLGFDKSNPPSYPSSKSVSPVSSSSSNNSPLPAESVLNFPLQKVDLNTSPSFSSSTSSLRRESENASPVRMSDVSVGNAGEGNDENENVNVTSKQQFVPTRLPPPPPLPPRRVLDPDSGLPILEIPSRSLSAPGSLNQNSYGLEKNEDTPGPKLKPLHWDKFRASYDRAMVGDQFKSSSFRLNEEMIETLFVINSSNNLTPKGNAWRAMSHPFNQENRVLEPKKYQNIAILLRALNVTVDEVCEALLEGNPDMLGTELLESLLKMAPTQEEENRLREFKNQSPVKLGPAEKFLNVVLDIPFAFKRIGAILYIAKFDSEIEYLSRSFETLEVACEELRNSRMFLELLEAILKTGNRMNVGTNRGDALAFKLDTLLKLVDVKSADDKTTLLHFVVQEIMSAEGSRVSGTDQDVRVEQLRHSDLRDEVELRKLGLQVVSGLSGELTNVKKAAAMESDVLYREVLKLVTGISKVSEVLKLNSEVLPQEKYTLKFSECMEEFLKKAEQEIVKIQAHESVALSMVKELTEYFHGNSAKEEAHPFRIFMIVRDFLQILDQVCKEVGKINERTMVGFSHPYPIPLNPNVPYIFPGSNSTRQQNTSSDDEGTHSSSLVSGID